jgi:hypothetical protein
MHYTEYLGKLCLTLQKPSTKHTTLTVCWGIAVNFCERFVMRSFSGVARMIRHFLTKLIKSVLELGKNCDSGLEFC